jgi:hypothetical protein
MRLAYTGNDKEGTGTPSPKSCKEVKYTWKACFFFNIPA